MRLRSCSLSAFFAKVPWGIGVGGSFQSVGLVFGATGDRSLRDSGVTEVLRWIRSSSCKFLVGVMLALSIDDDEHDARLDCSLALGCLELGGS